MNVEHGIGQIEGCETMADLHRVLQPIIENYGFAAFNFLDTGNPHTDLPYYTGTSGHAWEEEYASNSFVQVDPCVAQVRRTNMPFKWGDVPLPAYSGGRKPGAIKTMEAAYDHGFREGFVVPYHFCDRMGRVASACVVLFWKDKVRRFRFLLSGHRYELHLVLIYWMHQAIDIIARDHRGGAPIFRHDTAITEVHLTDRERDVLSWAARGKTSTDTAEILHISHETIETHLRNAMRKLVATNKTHAVAKSIFFGLIDV